MENLPVFVYGTLRTDQPNYENYLLAKVTTVHKGYITGAVLYNFGPFPGLVITGEPTQRVQGELMWLDPTRFGQIMTDLDYLEDCANQVYERQTIQVCRTDDATLVRAWVYTVGPALLAECSDIIPSGDWLEVS